MDTQKKYIVDTNVLLEHPESLFKLRNGNENTVYIPYHVLLELNKLKKDPRLGHIATSVIHNLTDHPESYSILETKSISKSFSDQVDRYILNEILDSGIDHPILVTNDKVFRLQADIAGIRSESYRESKPFQNGKDHYTGFIENGDDVVPNSFRWGDKGKPIFSGPDGEKIIEYEHLIWNVRPRNIYQNLAMELMTHPQIDVVSIQSNAGYGKSFLALASALYLTLEKKWFDKIYVVKPMIEIGQKLGYLPGRVDEKMEPYTRYISDLVLKLHRLRRTNRIFVNSEDYPPVYNPKRFELLPLTYIRGMNIENSVVIVDEIQNMSRTETRALLSRMGEGVKCICLGDIHQVDNPYLNLENNGMQWVVNKFKGSKIYAHLILKGEKSRGPITDLVISPGSTVIG